MTHSPSRVAVLAGAGNDIGLAVARELAGHGYRIALVDRKEALCYRTLEAVSAVGGEARIFAGDVRLVHEAEAVMTRIAEELGEPAVLVNNTAQPADFAPSALPAAEADRNETGRNETDWDEALRSGLRAPYLLSAAIRRYLVGEGWGRIITIGRPQHDGERGDIAASAAGDGVRGLTRALALDLGPHGVTVNAVLPGLIATESARTAADCLGVSFEDARKDALERIALGRPGSPQDVARAVRFFASEDAGFVSGQVLHVAGGPVG